MARRKNGIMQVDGKTLITFTVTTASLKALRKGRISYLDNYNCPIAQAVKHAIKRRDGVRIASFYGQVALNGADKPWISFTFSPALQAFSDALVGGRFALSDTQFTETLEDE